MTVIDIPLCRDKIAYWKEQLDLVNEKRAIDHDLREKLVGMCADRINRWNKRLQRLQRLHGETPENAA